MISHKGAYSKLVKPWGARLLWGKNKFHKPALLALGLSSSTIFVGIHALPLARFSAISAKNLFSLGYMCASMKASKRACISLTLSV